MKVLVIGNGVELLDKGKGEEIDKFDIVVRMNMFVTEGYEKDVGTKTDVFFGTEPPLPGWYNGQMKHSALRSGSEIECYDFAKYPDSYFYTAPKNFGEFFLSHYSTGAKHIVQPEWVKKFSEEIGLIPNHWPSTGLVAIQTMLELYGEIWAANFDFYKYDQVCYYSKVNQKTNFLDRGAHNIDKELAWFENKVKEGKIKIL